MWFTHAMKSYSAAKRKEIVAHTTSWVSLEDTCKVKLDKKTMTV